METFTVGQKFQFIDTPWDMMTITNVHYGTNSPFDYYMFDHSGFYITGTLLRSRLKTILKKIEGSCNHNFVAYHGFTDVFDYCTICNEKRN